TRWRRNAAGQHRPPSGAGCRGNIIFCCTSGSSFPEAANRPRRQITSSPNPTRTGRCGAVSIESTTLTASYRPLSDFEIMTLEVAGCTAEDWSRVLVAEDFNPRAIAHVDFSGDVRLGTFHETVRLMGGVERPT